MADTEENRKGPYDVAYFLASSLGRALPFIIVISLFAVGGWYFVRELSTLQTKLISAEQSLADAKVKQVYAESGARGAVDKAKAEIAAEHATRLESLNAAAIKLSQQVQLLVTAQVDNMVKMEDQSAKQARAAEERQIQIEAATKSEMKKLVNQVKDLETKRTALVTDLELAPFLAIRQRLIDATPTGYAFDRSLVEQFRLAIPAAAIQDKVRQDRSDKTLPWQYRAFLAGEVYSRTVDQSTLAELSELIFANRVNIKSGQLKRVLPALPLADRPFQADAGRISVLLRVASDDEFPLLVRSEAIELMYLGEQLTAAIALSTEQQRVELAGKLGKFLMSASERGGQSCSNHLFVLHAVSPEAAHVYGAWLLENRWDNAEYLKCIRTDLKNRFGGVKALNDSELARWRLK